MERYGDKVSVPIQCDLPAVQQSLLQVIRCKRKTKSSNSCETMLSTCLKIGLKRIPRCRGLSRKTHKLNCRLLINLKRGDSAIFLIFYELFNLIENGVTLRTVKCYDKLLCCNVKKWHWINLIIAFLHFWKQFSLKNLGFSPYDFFEFCSRDAVYNYIGSDVWSVALDHIKYKNDFAMNLMNSSFHSQCNDSHFNCPNNDFKLVMHYSQPFRNTIKSSTRCQVKQYSTFSNAIWKIPIDLILLLP